MSSIHLLLSLLRKAWETIKKALDKEDKSSLYQSMEANCNMSVADPVFACNGALLLVFGVLGLWYEMSVLGKLYGKAEEEVGVCGMKKCRSLGRCTAARRRRWR